MMESCVTFAMALVLLVGAGLIWAGGRTPGEDAGAEGGEAEPDWPTVALIIPVAGKEVGLAEHLASLLGQDYPSFQVILATRDLEDPAVPVILSLLRRFDGARHVVAGPARGCGQKNRNLLAALELAGDGAEVLVFCDAGHLARPDFLKSLVRPLARGEARVASGFHTVLPGDLGPVPLGQTICVLALQLAKGVRRLDQPWGGATAITRELWRQLDIRRLWARTVVDDVSLAARLKGAGIGLVNAAGATLKTPLSGESLGGWLTWLTRQWLYLKFYLPGSWLAAGLLMYLLAGLTLLSAVRLALLPWVSGSSLAASSAFLGAVGVLALAMRGLHPKPGLRAAWLAGCFAAIMVAAMAHLKTCFTQTLTWNGISYRIGLGGGVRGVKQG